ncbi:MAG: protein kinase [Gemmatimonadaceae bacterium]
MDAIPRPSDGAARWTRLRALFDELVELDATERLRRLETLGASDPDLRRAVEALLDADATADERLASLDPLAPAPDPLGLTGRTFSHFHVHEPLGAGGMGVVYRAEDTLLGRPVALKFLLPMSGADAPARMRLLHEARAAAALDHVNLCTIHEVGEDALGRMFFAMALYPGETLKARIERETRLPVADAVSIARQVASGLSCAHAAGIVHRDLKPANVMLLPDGAVKVLDFGLATARDQSLTTGSLHAGTPAYMAPEQVLGEPLSGRTDLWALGVLLYEMLTGRRPFDGAHEISIATAIVNREPVAPSTLRPDMPSALERLVLSLLVKEPARRVASADAVLAALDGASQTAPARARRTFEWSTSLVVAASAVIVILALGLSTLASRRAGTGATPAERSVAVLPFDNLSHTSESAELAVGLHDAVITQLTKVRTLRPISRQSVLAYAGSTKSLRRIGEELDVETVLRASVQQDGRRVRVTAQLVDARTDRHIWAGQLEREGTDDRFALENEITLAIVDALRAEITAEERVRLTRAPTRNPQAYAFYTRGREYQLRPPGLGSNVFRPGPDEMRAAGRLFRQAVALDTTFALAYARLAQVSPDPAEVRSAAATALRLQPHIPEAHVAMGWYWLSVGDDARALAEIAVARRGLPNDAEVQGAEAGLLRKVGRWNEALEGFRRAFRLDPRQPATAVALAFTYASLRRYDEAARTWDRAIELAPDNYRYLVEKGRVYVRGQGITDSLASALRRIPPDFDPAGHTTLARVDLEWLRRRPREALRAFDTMRPEVYTGDDYLNAAWMRMMRAWIHERLADTAAARVEYRAAAALLEGAATRDSMRARLHAMLGMAYAGLGRRSEAMHQAQLGMAMTPPTRDALFAPLMMHHAAIAYMHVGEMDAAVDLLVRLSTLPTYFGMSPVELRLDPLWDPLRGHPRFRRLVDH